MNAAELNELMELMGWTDAALADRLLCSERSIQRYRSGERPIKARFIPYLRKKLEAARRQGGAA